MQIIRECRMREAILIGLAKCSRIGKSVALVAKKWLTLAIIREHGSPQLAGGQF